MPENTASGIKAKFHAWLKKLIREDRTLPLWFLKTHGNQFQRAGTPDYLICANGQFLAIELKSPDVAAVPSPIQANEISKLDRAGALALVTNDLVKAQDFVMNELRDFL